MNIELLRHYYEITKQYFRKDLCKGDFQSSYYLGKFHVYLEVFTDDATKNEIEGLIDEILNSHGVKGVSNG